MDKFFDLRFVIGLFFSIIGLLILIHSFTVVNEAHQSVNRECSIAFLVFGVIMIVLAFGKDPKDKL